MRAWSEKPDPVCVGQSLRLSRNRRGLNEKDPEVRKSNFRERQEIAADTALAKAFLLRSSMIEGLRRAASIE